MSKGLFAFQQKDCSLRFTAILVLRMFKFFSRMWGYQILDYQKRQRVPKQAPRSNTLQWAFYGLAPRFIFMDWSAILRSGLLLFQSFFLDFSRTNLGVFWVSKDSLRRLCLKDGAKILWFAAIYNASIDDGRNC